MGAIGVGFFLSIVVVGMLFKLLILTGALEDLTIGITGLVATLFAAGIIFIIKKKKMDSFYKNIFLKGAIALLIGTSIYLTPTRSLIGFFYRNNPAFGELLLKAVENPYDKDIQKEYEEALERKNGNK